MICNICGNQMPDGTKFCSACGTSLIEAPQQAQPQQAQPVQPQQSYEQVQPAQPVQPVQQPQNFQQTPQQPVQPAQPQQPYQQAPHQAAQPTQPVQPQQPYQQAPQQAAQPTQQQPYQAQPAPQPSYQSGNAYGAQTPPPAKSKTPIIITAIVGAVLIVAIIAGTIIFLNKDKTDDKADDTKTTTAEADDEDEDDGKEDDTTASTNDAETETTEATTEEETTEEVVEAVSYAEENDVTIADSVDYSANAVLIFEDPDGNIKDYDGYFDVDHCTFTEKLGHVYKTAPDENGIVTYYAETLLSVDAEFTDTVCDESWTFTPATWIPDIADYYTGTVFNSPSTASGIIDESDEEVNTTVTMDDGTEYEISIVNLYDNNSNAYNWETSETATTITYKYYSETRYIYAIKAPEEYDGLMLAYSTGDVDYDEMISVKTYDGSYSSYKLFEESYVGIQNDPESTTCVRISDVASTSTSDLTAILSTQYVGTADNSFDWISEYDTESNPYIGGGVLINDISLLDGDWYCYMLWDKDNTLGCYAEEYLNVNVTPHDDTLDFEFDYNAQRWDKDGEWLDKSSEANSYYTGTLNPDGSISLTNDPLDCNFYLDGFFSDGYIQYATGHIILQSGEGADVFLYRP